MKKKYNTKDRITDALLVVVCVVCCIVFLLLDERTMAVTDIGNVYRGF